VLSNALIIAFASSSFDRTVLSLFPREASLAVRIAFVLIFEHFVLGVKVRIIRSRPQRATFTNAEPPNKTKCILLGSLCIPRT
jgi:hypothetical protein